MQRCGNYLGTPHSSLGRTPHPPTGGSKLTTPSPMPSLTPLPVTGTGKRPVTITFSEMDVPAALRNKYVTLPAEPMPASVSERLNIAQGMVEKSDDDAEVKRILAEADVFVKYGLVERAADHLRRVFERVPTHQGAHERLAAVLEQLDRKAEAAAEYEVLAQQCIASKPTHAAVYARKALELNPDGATSPGSARHHRGFAASRKPSVRREVDLDGAAHGHPRARPHRERRNRTLG
jgi:pilus assembly protein FimV